MRGLTDTESEVGDRYDEVGLRTHAVVASGHIIAIITTIIVTNPHIVTFSKLLHATPHQLQSTLRSSLYEMILYISSSLSCLLSLCSPF